MSVDLSILELILEASPLVQLVMATLVLASVLSWFVILRKRKVLSDARKAATKFEERFWAGTDLNDLYSSLKRRRPDHQGMEKIFENGYQEFARSFKDAESTETLIIGVQRSMKVTMAREEERLEAHLSLLATIGSTSPYVGLFGTVWGIMNSFRALGEVQHATLAMVAPGISEALIATAMGLFAAIPAVIAYNRYAEQVDNLAARYENFAEELATILQHQSQRLINHRKSAAAKPAAASEATSPKTTEDEGA